MRLWKRASALLKDRNSIYLARLSRRSSFRNPELEEAVIKATSHDESSIDYKNAQRIFTWIRTNPNRFLKPVIWALATRMEKTQYWVVALKGLMLMHGVFCCKIPDVHHIGRLPFDFSNFNDGYSTSPRTWGLCAFIRGYFAYLDQKSVLDTNDDDEYEYDQGKKDITLIDVLGELQKSQSLLDMLLQLKPYSDGWNETLILEAMDCIVIEIFDVYSRICNGIAGVLVRIYGANQMEAEMALSVLRKATLHGEELDSYFAFCREIGVMNASEFPNVEKIPDEDVRDLEHIINEISKKGGIKKFEDDQSCIKEREQTITKSDSDDPDKLFKTVITDKWVVFEDEFKVDEQQQQKIINAKNENANENANSVDPFAASINVPPLFFVSNNNVANPIGYLPMQQYHFMNSLQGPLMSTAGNQRNQIFPL